MDPQSIEEIEQLDRRISFLHARLSKMSSDMPTSTEKETLDLSPFQRQTGSEIKEQRTLLRVLLKGKPRPWYYHRLPRELLVKIFKWITHPGDQVNLRRALPGVGDLMKWDSVDLLYLKRIYPLVQDYLWPDWRDVWRLCQVSPEFMDVVLHHFEISLSNLRIVRRRHKRIMYGFMDHLKKTFAKITKFTDECEALGRTEWMTNMPFLVVFDLYCSSLDESPEFLAKFLDAHGRKVWACEVCHWTGGDDHGSPDLNDFLEKILRRTPNAVHFQFYFDNYYNNAVLGAPDTLPYLPRLRSLRCVNLDSEPFIRSYAAQLTSLAVQRFSPVFQNVSFPNLRYYRSRNLRELQVIPVPNALPDSIRESPLQSVRLFLSDDIEDAIPKIPAALCHLSHYENTLENLTLEFDRFSMMNWDVTGEQWKRRVRLAKVSRLELIRYQGKLDWLVALPSIRTLVLEEYNRRTKADVGERSPDLIYVSTHRIARFHNNIWTQLPNLRRLQIQDEWSLLKSSFGVTREEHEAFQNGGRLQKMAITILAVFQEIWAHFPKHPDSSVVDLRFIFPVYIFMVLLSFLVHAFVEKIREIVSCFSLGFIS